MQNCGGAAEQAPEGLPREPHVTPDQHWALLLIRFPGSLGSRRRWQQERLVFSAGLQCTLHFPKAIIISWRRNSNDPDSSFSEIGPKRISLRSSFVREDITPGLVQAPHTGATPGQNREAEAKRPSSISTQATPGSCRQTSLSPTTLPDRSPRCEKPPPWEYGEALVPSLPPGLQSSLLLKPRTNGATMGYSAGSKELARS